MTGSRSAVCAQQEELDAAHRSLVLGLVDPAGEAGAHGVLDLGVAEVAALGEAVELVAAAQGERQRLARDAELAGSAVDRGQRDPLGHVAVVAARGEDARVAGLATLAGW